MKQSHGLQVLAIASSFLQPSVRKLRNDRFWIIYLLEHSYAIKDLLKAEGYRWNTTGWKAWCRTYPAQRFSIEEFFAKAVWISCADGIEVRLYDDLETQIAIYRVEKGQCICCDRNTMFFKTLDK
jgi:hypothetical protein